MAVQKKRKLSQPLAVDLTGEAVHWDFRDAMSYGDYLGLKDLLACQRPLSGAHDETLFIVIHQASELWIKLCLHEIAGAIRQIWRSKNSVKIETAQCGNDSRRRLKSDSIPYAPAIAAGVWLSLVPKT